MTHETIGSIGYQVLWKQVEGSFMRVDSFTALSTVEGDKVGGAFSFGAFGLATVEILVVDAEFRAKLTAETGADSMWLQMPLKNKADYRVFYWLFEERGVAEDEEVWAMYVKPGLLAGSKGSISLIVFPKGTMAESFRDSGHTGQTPVPGQTDVQPIWHHKAGEKFAVRNEPADQLVNRR